MAVDAILRSGAEALIPEPVTKEIIQGTVEQSAVLSSFRKLPNMSSKTVSMPVLDMLPVAYFVNGDTGTKQTTKMAWAKKKIYAEEIAVIVPIPEAVIEDSSYDLWGEIKPRVNEAFGKKIDGAILFDVDKPAQWRDGVVTTAINAGAVVEETKDLYDDIMGEDGLFAKIENSGYMPSAVISSIRMRAKLRGLKDLQGRPLFNSDMQGSTRYALDGNPMIFPRNGAFDPSKSLMIAGDMTQGVYSIRRDITMKIFTEGVVQDPSTGEIVYNLMQNDMVALRAVMRLGWEIPNPINSLEPDAEKRCPFSIYTASAEVVDDETPGKGGEEEEEEEEQGGDE